MNLFWHGENCVSIQNSEAELVIDPQDLEKEIKLTKPADVFLLSSARKGGDTGSKSSSFIIDTPGEYDIKGFFVMGLPGISSGTVYVIESESIRVCYTPDVSKELTDEQLEAISDVDILLVNVGAGSDANEIAAKAVNQIEPRIVIPIGYDPAKPPKTFLEEMGASEVEAQNKFNVKKKDLPQEETKILLLNVTK